MRETIFAYTEPGVSPQFISINAEGTKVEVIVRSAGWGDGTCGDTACAVLSIEEVLKLAEAITKKYA